MKPKQKKSEQTRQRGRSYRFYSTTLIFLWMHNNKTDPAACRWTNMKPSTPSRFSCNKKNNRIEFKVLYPTGHNRETEQLILYLLSCSMQVYLIIRLFRYRTASSGLCPSDYRPTHVLVNNSFWICIYDRYGWWNLRVLRVACEHAFKQNTKYCKRIVWCVSNLDVQVNKLICSSYSKID